MRQPMIHASIFVLFLWLASLIGALTLTAGCGGPAAAIASKTMPAAPSWKALPTPLVVEQSPSALEVKTDTTPDWTAVRAGDSLLGVTHLRTAQGRGAVLRLDEDTDATGRIWLRGNTTLWLGSKPTGELFVRLKRGEGRVSLFESTPKTHAQADGQWVDITGRDALLVREAQSSRTRLVWTRDNVASADWSLAMDAVPVAAGVGTLQARPTTGDPSFLTLNALMVDGRRAGEHVAMRVEHVFFNPTDARMEGTFRFPLPDGAILTGLAMDINGQLMEGEIVERNKAKKIYQSIVDNMLDPAILEWEQGNTFKLRVFPIEPQSDKRVVLRYLAPIEHSATQTRFTYSTTAPAMQSAIGRFQLSFNGRVVVDKRAYQPTGDVVIPMDGEPGTTTILRETRSDGSVYTAIQVVPDWSLIRDRLQHQRRRLRRDRRRMIVLLDTSRSALESYPLALEALHSQLGALRRSDEFLVIASDVTARTHVDAFQRAVDDNMADAMVFARSIAPDGASDLSAGFERTARHIRAQASGRQPEVIYIGDGTATWGVTEPSALRNALLGHLDGATFSAILVGRGANSELLRAVADAKGGIVTKPRTIVDVRRFALRLAQQLDGPRFQNAHIKTDAPHQIHAPQRRTLFPGDRLSALIRTPAGATPPDRITLVGTLGGESIAQTISLLDARPGPFVSERWASREIAQLQQNKGDKSTIVALSKEFGVLSRYTAFLVLESEEAYRQHKIERRRGPNSTPKVTGGDLESLHANNASLNPNHIQPGDPEIRIPAPANARSVVVVFPFGETKIAEYEPALAAWTLRFLIDKDTADGQYTAIVRITHQNGDVEVLRLPYSVDTTSPTVRITVRPSRRQRGVFVLRATQIANDVELERVLPAWKKSSTKQRLRRRYAKLVMDAVRVEVRLPDGQVVRLKRKRDGHFIGLWRPRLAMAGEQTITVVAVDVPGNRNVFQQTIDLGGVSDHE